MMLRQQCRGAVDPVSLVVVVVVLGGGALLAGWKPLQVFRKKPPSAEVTRLQTDLSAAQAELAAARKAAADAATAERAAQEEQVRNAQQMTAGASAALARQPAEHRTPQTQLASDLLSRAEFVLGRAIGGLPGDKQAEIVAIVDKALSGIQSERDEARRLLAAKDAELQAITIEREQIKAQIPTLAAQLEAKEAKAQAVQAKLEVKTTQLGIWADRADKRERESGSLSASLERLIFWASVLVGLYLFAAYGVPPLLKIMRPGRTKTILRDVAGFASGGLHYLDARKKLKEARSTP